MSVEVHLPQGPVKALLICPDRAKATELARLLAPWSLELISYAGYPSTATLIALLQTPALGLCLLDVDSDAEAASKLLAEITQRAPGLPTVAVMSANNPDLILRCLRQGASDFLLRPFTADQLETVWERVARRRAEQAPAANLGRLIWVAPGKGSSGATSVAANLAFQFQRAGRQKVLLADLDPLTGTVAFLLKLKSTYSFLDALAHCDRLDADLWKVLVNPLHGVDVLLSPEEPMGTGEDWDPSPLLAFCRRHYEVAVLDVGSVFGEWNLALANLADDLLLVTTNELPALHATQRALEYLEENHLARSRLRVLVNRYLPERGLAADAIPTALETPVFHTLPNDYEVLQKAVMDGKPVSPGSRFGKAIVELAQRLNGRQEPAERSGSLLGSLFRKR